jgi:phenylacetate-coenzyme A ligase PaaK-like adenylate-forming protein
LNSFDSETKLEGMSLEDLVSLEEKKLRSTFLRAYESPLYRSLWKTVGVNLDSVHRLDDLSLLPLISRKEFFEATRTKIGRVACGSVSTWFAGSSPSNDYEWVPYNSRDYLGIVVMLMRMQRVTGLQNGDIVLAVVDLPPRIYSSIPYLWTNSQVSNNCKLEFIIGSLDWYDTLGMTWIDFIQRRLPTVVFSSTGNALMLANRINKELGVKAKDVLSNTRIGIFYGNPLEAVKTELLSTYSLEPYEAYSPTEHMSFWVECNYHQGLHVWMDACIPEIIPMKDEEAIPILEAPVGTKGELVITNFADCLPLFRFKTGELIRVESLTRCDCGRTHPRISRIPNVSI